MSRESVERDLHLEVCGNSIVIPVLHTAKGTIWWIFLDENQDPMYRGLEIEAFTDELPEKIVFEGIDLELVPVPKFDNSTKKYLDDSEPFEKTRRFWGQVTVEEVVLEVKFRLTVKKNGKWNFSARIYPEQPILGQATKATYEASSSSALKEIIDSLSDKDESNDT